jgi:hypothetical protein
MPVNSEIKFVARLSQEYNMVSDECKQKDHSTNLVEREQKIRKKKHLDNGSETD